MVVNYYYSATNELVERLGLDYLKSTLKDKAIRELAELIANKCAVKDKVIPTSFGHYELQISIDTAKLDESMVK